MFVRTSIAARVADAGSMLSDCWLEPKIPALRNLKQKDFVRVNVSHSAKNQVKSVMVQIPVAILNYAVMTKEDVPLLLVKNCLHQISYRYVSACAENFSLPTIMNLM